MPRSSRRSLPDSRHAFDRWLDRLVTLMVLLAILTGGAAVVVQWW